jgi:ADP-ribose pyrophosphatase YjhB (NUDIX family)
MKDKTIRVRACLAVVQGGRILLVPHFGTDVGPIQWNIPGGSVEFGESVQQTAIRELWDETGITARIRGLVDVSEVIIPERPWHSITITFLGEVISGELRSETEHPYGRKIPRWFTADELKQIDYHPMEIINKVMGIGQKTGC